jgi:hypothetical protein
LLGRVGPNRCCSNRSAAPPLPARRSTAGRVDDRRRAGPQSSGSFRRGPIQISQHVGQAFEPCRTLRSFVAASREPARDFQCHDFIVATSPRCVDDISEMRLAPLRVVNGQFRSSAWYVRLTGDVPCRDFAFPIFRVYQPSRTLCSFGEEEPDEGHSECKCEAIPKALYLHRLPVLLS